LWEVEHEILSLIFPKLNFSHLFLDIIPVSPSRFRPISVLGDKKFDHAQNNYLNEIIKQNNNIKTLNEAKDDNLKLVINAWVSLQEAVNNLIDSNKNPKEKTPPPGIKHMMGKRVNFAARSVISPDPMIQTNEIGIPLVFAQKLTYPEPVTHHNVKELRQAVINGPETYPGAVSVINEDGTQFMLSNISTEQRIALANQLLIPTFNSGANGENTFMNKKVTRHLKNGDMLLLNRQPTLHKPSIMGHVARILPGEKTIRMHYANCNTYNADFDGDEMNVHFPQNPIAQAEARLIANTNNQYLVPTSGEPLRGLIQDHVVIGVLMTSKETFFTKDGIVFFNYKNIFSFFLALYLIYHQEFLLLNPPLESRFNFGLGNS
jgi:DNA-directed RNA polymerase I subunit RPA1